MNGKQIDPVTQAVIAGVIGGVIPVLLDLNPLNLTLVRPLLAAFGLEETQLVTAAILAIQKANAETIAQGYHHVWNPDNPASPGWFVDKYGNKVGG